MAYRAEVAPSPGAFSLLKSAANIGDSFEVWTTVDASQVQKILVGQTVCSFTVIDSQRLSVTAPSSETVGKVTLVAQNWLAISDKEFAVYDRTKLNIQVGSPPADPRFWDAGDGLLEIMPYGLNSYTYTKLIRTSSGGYFNAIDYLVRTRPWPADVPFRGFFLWSSTGGSSPNAASSFNAARIDGTANQQLIVEAKGTESLAVPVSIPRIEEGDEVEVRFVCEPDPAGQNFVQVRINGAYMSAGGGKQAYGAPASPGFGQPFNSGALILGGLLRWAASTAYAVGVRVSNAGRNYICVTAGTSASSGGPTTAAAGITDGSAVWDFVGEGTGACPSGIAYFSSEPRTFNPLPCEFVVFGDSTSAQYLSWRSIAASIYTPEERWTRPGIMSFASGGDTIGNQKTAWDGDYFKGKPSIKAFLIMLGYNDINGGASAATVTASLQSLVNDIAAANPATPIILAQILPPGPGTGWSGGQITIWNTVNDNIAGTGGTPITGVTPMTEHMALLGSGSNLYDEYYLNNPPHENSAGRKVIAECYRRKLHTLGLLP